METIDLNGALGVLGQLVEAAGHVEDLGLKARIYGVIDHVPESHRRVRIDDCLSDG